jgi:hypothetical protein
MQPPSRPTAPAILKNRPKLDKLDFMHHPGIKMTDATEDLPKPAHGGARPGAGRKPGHLASTAKAKQSTKTRTNKIASTVINAGRSARGARDLRGRWLAKPPGAAASWPKGFTGNPGGRTSAYGEMQRRAREFSPEAAEFLIEIVRDKSEDSRNRIVAAGMILDRAWGKAKEMPERDPKAELQDMTDEQLAEHTAELLIEGGMPRATAIKFLRSSLKLDRERSGE